MSRISLVFGGVLAASVLSACAGMTPVAMPTADPAVQAAVNRQVQHRCAPQIAAALTGLGMPAADIRSVGIEVDGRNSGESVWGTDAWVYSASKPGAVIISMADNCTVRQVYGRDGMAMPSRTAS